MDRICCFGACERSNPYRVTAALLCFDEKHGEGTAKTRSQKGRGRRECCCIILLSSAITLRFFTVPLLRLRLFEAISTPTEANFNHPAILLSRLQFPPWRSAANASNGVAWHVGVSTGKMLEDLWRTNKTQQNPPLLAQIFLKKLDQGEFHVDDLGSLCALVLKDMPMYWRKGPAWTSNLNASDNIYFAEPGSINSSLATCLEDLVDRWQEKKLEDRADEVVLLKAFALVGDFLFTFLHIHPFIDGNGRCSRWMGGWMLSKDLGFQVELPNANETTRYALSPMPTSRYLMLLTLDQEDASLFTAFLVDCAWSQIQPDA